MDSGWWDVYSKDWWICGQVLLARSRATKADLLGDQYEQFQTMKQTVTNDVKETLRSHITNHLHSLLFNPAKREKAMVAAEKLGIDLTVHDVHAFKISQIRPFANCFVHPKIASCARRKHVDPKGYIEIT